MFKLFLDANPDTLKMIENPTSIMDSLADKLDYEAHEVAERVRANASGAVVKEQSGDLAASVQVTPAVIEGGRATVTVLAGGGRLYYGKILERGTKAYEILPRYREAVAPVKGVRRGKKAREGKHALKFLLGGGTTVFAKFVQHPAMARHRWFSSVLDQLAPQIVEDVVRTVDVALNNE